MTEESAWQVSVNGSKKMQGRRPQLSVTGGLHRQTTEVEAYESLGQSL